MILDPTILEKYDNVMSTSKVYDCLPIIYPILGLNGEAGEAAEKVKKCLRDNKGKFDEETKYAIKKELADVLWYIWAAADDMDTSLDEIMSIGIKKVKERQATNTVHGNGDNREESYDSDFPEYTNNCIHVEEEHIIIKMLGEYESLKKISYKLGCSSSKKVNIKLKDSKNNVIYEYTGVCIGFGKMDGGILIKLDDELKTTELIENIHELTSEFPYYWCEINEDELLDRRVEQVPIIYR